METEQEKRIWTLLTRDFTWEIPTSLGVGILEGRAGPERFQVFEVATAVIFNELRPEYEWSVTPNRPDGGIDFVGRHGFLVDEALGISAAITIGGQCKKRTTVGNVVHSIVGSLADMASSLKPTFFVVALSARLDPGRVAKAKQTIETFQGRQCDILERNQLEVLVSSHFDAIEPVLDAALRPGEVEEVRAYFQDRGTVPVASIEVAAPERVLAGRPFVVSVGVQGSVPGSADVRITWRPVMTETDQSVVNTLAPFGIDTVSGASVVLGDPDSPLGGDCPVEMVCHGVGIVDLGEVCLSAVEATADASWIHLGQVRVVENFHPRFFVRPFRAGLSVLSSEFDRVGAGGLGVVGVVGSGGSGKSRLCDEFSLERRRHGAVVMTARQAKSHNDPMRLLAEMLNGLVRPGTSLTSDPAESTFQALQQLDPTLAVKVMPSIRSVFGTPQENDAVDSQALISALIVLSTARARKSPVIIHLQELHWCSADVLGILERFVWQLEQIHSSTDAPWHQGLMLICEGRQSERERVDAEGWESEQFESLLQQLDCPVVRCGSFSKQDGLEFIQQLFEDRYAANRALADGLLELQHDLIESIDRTAGGSPFHSLEQVRLLKELGIVGQNKRTGLLYLIRPPTDQLALPSSVFEAIQLRWQYLRARDPDLALLVWSCALLDDRVPEQLFRALWRELAPDASLAAVDAIDMLRSGIDTLSSGVAFRHENYFHSIRRFEVDAFDRQRVVDVYVDWFAGVNNSDAAERFKWARALLASPEPRTIEASALLAQSRADAMREGDSALARRILAVALDLEWSEASRSALSDTDFLEACDQEISLVTELLGVDRHDATRRLDELGYRLERRTWKSAGADTAAPTGRIQQIQVDVLRAQLLYNDRQALAASAKARVAVESVCQIRASGSITSSQDLGVLETEARHTEAVALALSGEIDEALDAAKPALEMATAVSPATVSSLRTIGSYANILLARDSRESESLLRRCRSVLGQEQSLETMRYPIEVNLGMALTLRAHTEDGRSDPTDPLLLEARSLFQDVFTATHRIGRYVNAAAASLMLGIVSVIDGRGDPSTWFAQSLAAASRGHKPETMWRAHINLATSMFVQSGEVSEACRDHAGAALAILSDTLSPYSDADRSARYEWVEAPLVQATRLLLIAGDESGRSTASNSPRLRSWFADLESGALLESKQRDSNHEWLVVDEDGYVIY